MMRELALAGLAAIAIPGFAECIPVDRGGDHARSGAWIGSGQACFTLAVDPDRAVEWRYLSRLAHGFGVEVSDDVATLMTDWVDGPGRRAGQLVTSAESRGHLTVRFSPVAEEQPTAIVVLHLPEPNVVQMTLTPQRPPGANRQAR